MLGLISSGLAYFAQSHALFILKEQSIGWADLQHI